MTLKYSCIQIFAVFFGTTYATSLSSLPLGNDLFLDARHWTRNLDGLGPFDSAACDAADIPIEECSEEYKQQAIADIDERIDSLQELYDDDLDCKSSDENKDSCENIAKVLCDLIEQKVSVVEDIDKACSNTENGRVAFAEFTNAFALAKAEAEATRALQEYKGPGSKPTCITTALSQFKDLKDIIKAINISIQALNIAIAGFELLAALAPDFFTDTGKFFEAVGKGVNLVVLALQSVVFGFEEAVKDYESDDSVCNDEFDAYFNDFAVDTYVFLGETLSPKVDSVQDTADSIEKKVDIIDGNVDNSQIYLEFLSCQFEEKVTFVGAGCDGIDNDCDSLILNGIKLVDECDEDQVPPTITLTKNPPATFLSQAEAEAWFMGNTMVFDDCAPSDRLSKSIVDSSTVGQISIQVEDTRCANNIVTRALRNGKSFVIDGIGQPSTIETFEFIVDGEPPIVTCGFNKPQDVNFAGGDPLFIDFYNENVELVDVKFWYDIKESPPTPYKDVQVSVTITSNEFENSGERQIAATVKQRNLGGSSRRVVRVNTLLAPLTCGDDSAGSLCLRENGSNARFYDITVVATDFSGNVGDATCTVVAVPEYDCPSKCSKGKSKGSKKETEYDCTSECSKGKSKGSKKEKRIRPSRSTLISQLEASEQRFVLDEIEFVWNVDEDDSMINVNPATNPPRSTKNDKQKTPKESRRASRG